MLQRPHEVQTAFALESVLDEVVFVVGPVLITTLASLWHPVAGLSVALAVGVVGTAAYAAAALDPAARREGAGGR